MLNAVEDAINRGELRADDRRGMRDKCVSALWGSLDDFRPARGTLAAFASMICKQVVAAFVHGRKNRPAAAMGYLAAANPAAVQFRRVEVEQVKPVEPVEVKADNVDPVEVEAVKLVEVVSQVEPVKADPVSPEPVVVGPRNSFSRDERAKMIEGNRALIKKLVREGGVHSNDRDDVIQDVMLTLWKSFDNYDPMIAKFSTFTHHVARHAILEYVSQRSIRPQLISVERSVDPPDGSEDGEGAASGDSDEVFGLDDWNQIFRPAAVDAIATKARLSAGYRRLLKMFADRLTAPEIADQLGQKLSVVEINMRPLVRKLVASDALPAELVERFAAWKEVDKINPARKARYKEGKGWKEQAATKKANRAKETAAPVAD
ncbi:MAG TPA: sigma-70 family RNA polymerase sigma factor [Gemmataceae bacterium]|jgi:RNA polymerase sigma factor (sigma-70 family)|nr:sigma-70 family RNA polymerase sigma factor [Gemmataceae bacterium]